jgi:hypothetical protein
MFKSIEALVMSCEVFKDKLYFFKKSKILIITDKSLIWLSKRKKAFKKKESITNVAGVTKSLL